MNEEALLTRIQELPNPIKAELLDYMDFLVFKHNPQKETIHPKAGCMKGTFVISDDFNESLNVLRNICHENIIRHSGICMVCKK